MDPISRQREAATRADRRLTWLTVGTAAFAVASTGVFAVAAAATYAGEPRTAQVTDGGALDGSDSTTNDPSGGGVPSAIGDPGPGDPAATAAPIGGVQVVPAAPRRKHATSGGSH